MKNIFILDEYVSSMKNGIGTYLKELLYCLGQDNVNICLLRFNSVHQEFTIHMESDIKIMSFPALYNIDFRSQCMMIDKLFRLYINDSKSNLFFLNHSPCENLITQIKESFPLSKIVFVIHDFGWTSPLLGDFIKLKEVIHDRDLFCVKDSYRSIVDYFEEEKRMYACVDKIICLSKDSYHLLKTEYGIDEKKIAIIPNGLRDRRKLLIKTEKIKIRKEKFLLKNEKIILFVGRPCMAKGLYSILKGFDAIVKEEPNCRLIVIGGGGAFDTLCAKSIALSRISFIGQITQSELDCWYQVADVGIIASYTEQCSFTGIEMMMYGLPIVSSDGFGVRNMFQDRYNAKIIKVGKDEFEYANNIFRGVLELLGSKSDSNILRKNAREVYEKNFGIEKMQEGYHKLINSL